MHVSLSFDDLLASYTGDVKAKMEAGGDCVATSTTMFSTNESVARAELARLKAANAVCGVLRDTPHGRQFEANVGDPLQGEPGCMSPGVANTE